MRVPLLIAGTALPLLISLPSPAVTMDWTPIGNPGNACDPQSQGCFGSVPYSYSIGTYEVTNAQYVEFLNAKAASDPLGLYNASMGSGIGGITRSGSSGNYSYSAIAGRRDMPVDHVSFYDALRFANWMNNGQGNGDTETGAYTLLGPYGTSLFGSGIPSNGTTVTRNAGATIFLTSENEWYKAAYFSPLTASYFDYPTGSNVPPTCSSPSSAPNRANCAGYDFLPVGSFPGSRSPSGTYDQGGNAMEWTEAIGTNVYGDPTRILRGGNYAFIADAMASSIRFGNDPTASFNDDYGFRLAMVPEPGTGLLVIAGLIGLAIRRRRVSTVVDGPAN